MKTNLGTGTDMTRHVRRTAVALLLCSLALPAWGQQYYLYEPKPVSPDAKREAGDGVLVKDVPVQSGDTLSGISRKFSGHGTYYPQILLFNNIKDPNLIYTGDTLKIPLPKGGIPETAAPAKRRHGKKLKQSAKPAKKASAKAAKPLLKKHSAGTGTAKSGESPTELPLSELKKLESGKAKRHAQGRNSADIAGKKAAVADSQPEHKQEKIAVPTQRRVEATTPKPTTTSAVAGQQLFEKAVKAYRQDDYRAALELFDRYLADNPNSPLAADASLFKAECYLKLSSQ